MPAIANRYILRETAQTWALVTVVLLLILVTTQFAQVLGDAASSRVPKDALFMVMGLASLQYMTILVPVGLFLSILLALGRLYRDSEMFALMACGVGPGALYRPLMVFAAGLALVVGWLAVDVAPAATAEVKRIAQEARARADLRVLEAGRFISFGQADAVVYAEDVSADGTLHNVFVERRHDGNVEVVVAEKARQADTADPDVKLLTFSNGRRYEGEPGRASFRVVQFAEHGIPYRLPGKVAAISDPETRPFAGLFTSRDPADIAELQWRLSAPLMVLVLAFLAVPMGRSSPRQGRYAGLGAGVLVYVSYANLLGASRVWLERGQLPAVVGLWWVHALFVMVALLLLGMRYGSIRLPRLIGGRAGSTP